MTLAPPEHLTPPYRPYQPYGAAERLLYCREPEVVLAGPAGTGKSRAVLEKLHLCAEKYAGMRALIVRKTRESLTESALVTFEEKVIPEGHRALAAGGQRRVRQAYHYPNGSVVVVGGLDKPSKVMSTEYDLCLTGDTEVFSPSPVECGSSRPYSGRLVIVATARGNKLTGTPNHPVLTPHGWVSLGGLRKGDYVISRRRSQPLAAMPNPDVTDKPTAIAEVVHALAESGGRSGVGQRVEAVPMHFHGDGAYGYVDAVTSGRLFQDGRFSGRGNPVAEPHGGRADFQQVALTCHGTGFKRLLGRRASLDSPFAASELTHALSVGLGPVPRFHGTPPRLGKFALPFGVGSHPFLTGREGVRGVLPLYASGGHFPLEPGDADVNGQGYLEQPPLPSEVTTDRVVDVFFTDVADVHVFNLQTEASWYYASNIIVHNCYVQEAIELSEGEWEALTTRLRNGVMPYQQALADTNPDTPTHWLRRRADAGRLLMLESRHEDNPTLWDSRRRDWTTAGASYVAKLDALTGPRKDRLRFGRWVQAEGVVYEGWDAAVHVIDRFAVPTNWPRYWSVDFGFTNPFVCQFWARDGDGRLYLYREIYRTQRLVEDHARRMLAVSGAEPRPPFVICDHDAEDRATLEKHLGMPTVPAKKDVSPGIQCVAARLRPAGDGRPRLFVMRDCLDERDQALADAKKPTCLVEEVDGYIWDLAGKRRKGEAPVDKDNHSMDAMRYAVAHFDFRVNPGDPAAGGSRPDYAAGAVGGAAAEGPGRRRGQMPVW